MLASIKAEFRKLLSVRSTYFLSAVALLLSVFISFWVFGYKDVEKAGDSTQVLFHAIINALTVASLFLSFLAVLLVGHEYRYNLITYTLTSAKRRSQVFLAKLFAVSVLAIAIAVFIGVVSVPLFYLGQHMHHIHTLSQVVPGAELMWRGLITVLGSIGLAFVVTMLVRSLIGAITITLVMPTTIEPLLGLLLKDNTKYLPYTALGNVSNTGLHVSYLLSTKVVIAYIVVAGAVAYILFARRDAN